ncbi:MAG: hypothetical protein ABH827_01660 [bacterium]
MKKHISFTLALILSFASHANHAHSMKNDNNYDSDANSDTEVNTNKLTTKKMALDLLEKKAIKLSKIADQLKKLAQSRTEKNPETEPKIQIKINLLLDKTKFIINTLLNLETCKSIKNKHNKEILQLQAKINKLRDQVTNKTFREITPQILSLTLEANNFICDLLKSETKQETRSREKYNKIIKIIGITTLIIVGITAAIATGVYLGWWRNEDNVTCFDKCITQYKDLNCIPEYTNGSLTKPCLIEELCNPDFCLLDNDAQITTFDNCTKNKCTPIQIGRNPQKPKDTYYKIKRSKLLPENSNGQRCLENDKKRCEIYVN